MRIAPEMPQADRSAERRLADQLLRLHADALRVESEHAADIASVEPTLRPSARNLLHYLSLRQHDIRTLQLELLACGLSSLSNSEAHTLASLEATLARLDPSFRPAGRAPVDFLSGPLLLAEHSQALLGPPSERRSTRIMVTMPSEAAEDLALVRELLRAGMEVMRINCAHDDAAAWKSMVRNLRLAEQETGLRCRIQADLAGPKLRTGGIEPLGRVLRLKPSHDAFGALVAPAWVPVVPAGATVAVTGSFLAVDAELHALAREGDTFRLRDARGRSRELELAAGPDGSLVAQCRRGAFLVPGIGIELLRERAAIADGRIVEVPSLVRPIELRPGDMLMLTRAALPGRGAGRNEAGEAIEPARIHCTLSEVFSQVRVGERISFDDGKIGGVIEGCDPDILEVRITQASPRGSRLREGKGINFPDTALRVPALGGKDLADLAAIAPLVDIVALSFVRTPQDVLELHAELARLGASGCGVVLKIENREAFENLPDILLASLRSQPVGIMVARGDLAVEIGFERLSEVQEEILWLCEAAHVPVVWATQMLEGLAKKGMPSRAEVTDAAASGRAECAMLNKGPNIVRTVRFLSDILERMANHRAKRRPALRRLAVTGRV